MTVIGSNDNDNYSDNDSLDRDNDNDNLSERGHLLEHCTSLCRSNRLTQFVKIFLQRHW